MFFQINGLKSIFCAMLCIPTLMASSIALAGDDSDQTNVALRDMPTSIHSLAKDFQVGDLVFIRVSAKPFREVAAATNSWTNHVGIVIDTAGEEPLIGESTFPFSRTTTLSRFVARSEKGRIAVARLKKTLSPEQQQQVRAAADRRSGIFYDTGFDLHSHRQFCSRYAREVLSEATGENIGEIETFANLLKHRPDINLGFWKTWYLGHIPWERETVTPASLLQSPRVSLIFNGAVAVVNSNARY